MKWIFRGSVDASNKTERDLFHEGEIPLQWGAVKLFREFMTSCGWGREIVFGTQWTA